MKKQNIAVLVSGGGTNLQALIDAEKAGKIPHGKITLVIASNPTAYALTRAANAGIESAVVSRKEAVSQNDFEEKIIENNITFDYQLKTGRATTQNAISLLGMLGYPEEIINQARQAAAHFVDKGEWQSVT